jgi:hypothetical protein
LRCSRSGLREAVLSSCGANAAHGVPRTNEDKRRAVMKLLNDTEWSGWVDLEIARRAHVSNHFVRKLREELAPLTRNIPSEPRTFHEQARHRGEDDTAAIEVLLETSGTNAVVGIPIALAFIRQIFLARSRRPVVHIFGVSGRRLIALCSIGRPGTRTPGAMLRIALAGRLLFVALVFLLIVTH